MNMDKKMHAAADELGIDIEEAPQMTEEEAGEAFVHTMLALVVEHPGVFGRLRATRVIMGFSVPEREDHPVSIKELMALHSLEWAAFDITLRRGVELTDAMLSGGLLKQTPGIRPTLVPTRAGFRALEALEQMR